MNKTLKEKVRFNYLLTKNLKHYNNELIVRIKQVTKK